MIKNFKKITVVGGGSAGWMTASMLIKTFPDIEIEVVESHNIPIIGVGESTLGGFNDFCQYLGIDEKDFMQFTDASYKMSIKFTDFYDVNSGGFHYPFGEPYLEGTYQGLRDWFFKKAIEDVDNQDFVRSYFPAASLFEQNKFSLNNGEFDNFNPVYDVAYHFDAVKFSGWLKEKFCLPRGVKHLIGEVEKIEKNDQGIEKIILADNTTIYSDLFIDCTGFKSLLLGGSLGVDFESYEEMLPNNRAWATRIPYQSKEQELEPFTNCTAIQNGWVWNIPLWSRLGSGYVYSDKFINPDDALQEFKKYLQSDKMQYPRTKEQIEQLEFRDISFKVGIYKETFVKNVVAIGLSAAFIEPLESNGLFSVHQFLFKLMKTLKNRCITQWDRDTYNSSVRGLYNNFAEFVALHYALSVRNDTEYWKAITNKIYDKGLAKLQPTMNVGFVDFVNTYMFTNDPNVKNGITYISTGMNRPMLDEIDQKLYENREYDGHKSFWRAKFLLLEQRREKWKALAHNKPTLYQYLKRNIHNG